jgi:hypothetical protein
MGYGNNNVLFVRIQISLILEIFSIYNRISGRHPYVANEERRLLEIIRSQKLRFDSEKFRNLSSEGFSYLYLLYQ